MRWIYR